jgi:hypothetical protein
MCFLQQQYYFLSNFSLMEIRLNKIMLVFPKKKSFNLKGDIRSEFRVSKFYVVNIPAFNF